MIDPKTALLVVAVGGLLGLDRVAFLQSMVSRPLPVSAITGMILGEPELGLLCGLYMELIWLGRLPVGGSVPPDETLAALAAVLAAAATPGQWSPGARAAAGVLAGLPYGLLGRRLELVARGANAKLGARLRTALENRVPNASGRLLARGALNFLAAGLAGALLAVLTAQPLCSALVAALPFDAGSAMGIVSVAIPVIGAGALLGTLRARRQGTLFLAGAFAAWGFAKAGIAKAASGLVGAGRAP